MSAKKPQLDVAYATFVRENGDEQLQTFPDGSTGEPLGQQCFDIWWGAKGFGFGGLYFYVGEDKQMHCSNEFMSKNAIKKILNKMVDDCVLDDVHDENDCFSTGHDNKILNYPRAYASASDGRGGVCCVLNDETDIAFFEKLVESHMVIPVIYKDKDGNQENIMDIKRCSVTPYNRCNPETDSRKVFDLEGVTVKSEHYAKLIARQKANLEFVCSIQKLEYGKVQVLIEDEQMEIPF